jgi:bacilliredoxin
MPYPDFFVAPMREELVSLGIKELRTPAEVDTAITKTPGTLLLVVNSICGCAAGKARPGLALALSHSTRPDHLVSVFAGFDIEATDRARGHIKDYRPSSPSMALFRDGELVYMLERQAIENRDALAIANELAAAFDRFCAAPKPA